MTSAVPSALVHPYLPDLVSERDTAILASASAYTHRAVTTATPRATGRVAPKLRRWMYCGRPQVLEEISVATIPAGLHSADARLSHKSTCAELIRSRGFKSICEIGGGRAPLFSLGEVAEFGIDYTVLDISSAELALVPQGYETLEFDICDPALGDVGEKFDFMFSRMLAEHVPDGAAMHRNTFSLLRPGGQVFHFFPTLYAPVFVANRLFPEKLSSTLQKWFAPRTEPKFPAHYSLCRGPTPRMMRILAEFGFQVEEYRPFYGASGYFQRLPPLRLIDDGLSSWAARRRNPYLTSFAFLRLGKPA